MFTRYVVYKGPLDGLSMELSDPLMSGDEVAISVDVTNQTPPENASDGVDHVVNHPTDVEAIHIFDGRELVYAKTVKLKNV